MKLVSQELPHRVRRFLLIAAFSCVLLRPEVSYTQGVIAAVIPGDFADPSVISRSGTYYAVGTSSEWAPHFPIFSSPDLKHWSMDGYVFDKAPDWTAGSFWAPEYFFHNNTYFIYYTARRKSDNVSCIGVATSKYPNKGFQDKGVVVAYGKEAIDGFVYNEDGKLYITFKAYGLDDRPIEILASKLSNDGLKMEGEVFSMLKDDDRIGMEGQCIVKRDGFYYLFYSTGNCCGKDCSYDVRVAKASNLKGPYEKNLQGPVLTAAKGWKCAGHGTLIKTSDGEDYYLHHAYNNVSDVFTGRQGMLAKLSWPGNAGWPLLLPVNFTEKPPIVVRDDFDGSTLRTYWQHDFRNASAQINQLKGKLSLKGTFKKANQTGVVATVRPASDSFEMEATVSNFNHALKGLVFYGDASAAIGIGVIDDRVELWMVREGRRDVVKTATIGTGSPVKLKLVAGPDRTCKMFYKLDLTWIEMTPESSLSIDFLPQWDRSPRPGLHFKGPVGSDAQFDDFEIRYLPD